MNIIVNIIMNIIVIKDDKNRSFPESAPRLQERTRPNNLLMVNYDFSFSFSFII